jgi:hypothetical protein
VVTPYTSLIVLENDEMYARYKVERGRKDHWALYDAPKEMEVVREEIDWSRWGWYGNFQGEDGKLKVSSKPKSIQDIVDSVQIRINAPFYFYPPQPQSDSRTGLYHLAAQSVDAKNDPTKLLTLWFLLASGERKPLADWNRSVAENSVNAIPGDDGSPTASSKPAPPFANLAQLEKRESAAYFRQLMPMFEDRGRGGRSNFFFGTQAQNLVQPQLTDKRLQMQDMLLSRLDDPINLRSISRRFAPAAMLSAYLGAPSSGPISPELNLAFQQAVATRWARINSDVTKYNQQNNYGYWGGAWGDYGGSLDLGESQTWWGNASGLDELMGNLAGDGKPADAKKRKEAQSFMLSALLPAEEVGAWPLSSMMLMDRELPVAMGMSLADESFASGDLMALDPTDSLGFMYRGGERGGERMQMESLMGGGIAAGGFIPMSSQLQVAPEGISRPMMMFDELASSESYQQLPLHALVRLSQAPVKSQPGMTAILAGEFLSARRETLRATIANMADDSDKKEKAIVQAELNAIEAAIANIDKAAVRLEDTGKFWGWNAWSYQPQSHQYAVPQVQAYNGYNWSFDLTRYADGLYSSTQDMVDEVLNEYGTAKPLGHVDDSARQRIDAARDAVKTVEIRFAKDGQKILVGSNDRYAATSRNEMYLEEQVVCDGKHLDHVYNSLGLIARRNATDMRLSMLRRYTPHLLEPADSLANWFEVTLNAEDDASFTLKLSAPEVAKSADETAEEKTANEQPAKAHEATADVYLLVQVDRQGRILRKQVVVDGEVTFTMTFSYDDDQVAIRWIDKAGEELHKVEFFAKQVDDVDDAFVVKTDDRVVFEMPLRKPSFYLQQLQELAAASQVGEKQKGPPAQDGVPALPDGATLPELKFSDENLAQAIQLKRHQVLSLLQNFDWRRWGQQNQEATALLNQVAAMQQQLGGKITRGDVTLYGSAGMHNLIPTLQAFRDVSQMPVANYFQGRHTGFADWNKTFADEQGLLGHLAAYHIASQQNYQKEGAFDEFAKSYPQSPLLLALAFNISNYTGKIDSWLELNKQPQWSGFSLLMSVNYLRDEAQQKKFTVEFWRWRDELAKEGLEPVLPANVANIIRNHSEPEQLTQLLAGQFEKAKKTESIPVLLEFAEYVSSMSETKIADQAYELVREKLGLDQDKARDAANAKGETELELIKRFAYAQSLWAGRRNREALDQFNLIFAELKSKNITPSPAFLGATARLAQQAGDAQQAFELEEQALVAEQPYLPEMINLQAFRQRYQWLWSQYTQAIANVPADDKDRQAKLDDLIARAEATWIRWYEVDRDNPGLPGEMATMLKNAGREKAAWKYLSTTIDRKPRDASSYYQLGVWYTNNGANETALDWYAQAPQWDTANPQWIYHYGMALKNAGKTAEANAQFQKVVDGQWAPGLQGWINNAQQQMTVLE